MELLTAEQMNRVDRYAAEQYGLPPAVLMENAGRALAEAALRIVDKDERSKGHVRRPPILVLVGGGNNGGDGLVAARHCAIAGQPVRVFAVPPSRLSGSDSRSLWHDNARALSACPATAIIELERWEQLSVEQLLAEWQASALVIDAWLGTGFRGPLRPGLLPLIRAMAHERRGFPPVLAADIPSGVDSDSGHVDDGVAVRADVTVTFCRPKWGLYLYPGALYAGRVEVADIGIPRQIVNEIVTPKAAEIFSEANSGVDGEAENQGRATSVRQVQTGSSNEQLRRQPDLKNSRSDTLRPTDEGAETVHGWLLQAHDLAAAMPHFDAEDHKGSRGRVLIIAGSTPYAGSALLAAGGAINAGVGLVDLWVPENIWPVVAGKIPELIVTPFSHFERESPDWTRYHSVLIGPGLGADQRAVKWTKFVWEQCPVPLVIDADGLNALARLTPEQLSRRSNTNTVLTPHIGELARLISGDTKWVREHRLQAALRAAARWRATVVGKGPHTLIVADDCCLVNSTGNPALATAGSGDVLAGLLTGWLARTQQTRLAAGMAVFLHGLAADLAVEQMSAESLSASVLLRWLGSASARLKERGGRFASIHRAET